MPVEEVRELDVREIAERLGLDMDRSGMAACVDHLDGGRPNMKVFENGVYCFRCDYRADGIGLVQHVMGGNFHEAVEWIASESDLQPGEGHRGRKRLKRSPRATTGQDTDLARLLWEKFCDLAHAELPKDRRAWAWLQSRGLDPAEYGRFHLGAITDGNRREIEAGLRAFASVEALQDAGLYGRGGTLMQRNRVIFPFIRGGRVVGLQGRTIDNTPPKYLIPTGCRLPLYNIDAILEAPAGGTVWICEGPIDAIAVEQSGRLAVGVAGTAAMNPADFVNLAGLTVVLCMDADEAGREAIPKLVHLSLLAGAKRIFKVELPEGTDAAEWDWQQGRPPLTEITGGHSGG